MSMFSLMFLQGSTTGRSQPTKRRNECLLTEQSQAKRQEITTDCPKPSTSGLDIVEPGNNELDANRKSGKTELSVQPCN